MKKLAVFAALLLSGGCAEKRVAASNREVTPVRAYQVDWSEFSTDERYAAVTEPETQLDLAFRTAGVVMLIYRTNGRALEPGDRVPAGAVLAQLRVLEYQARAQQANAQVADARAGRSVAEANVREAEAGFTQSQADFDRAKALFDVQAMTRADLDAARARFDASDAKLKAARTAIASYDARIHAASAVSNESRVPLSDTTIRAPFAAVIVARRVEQGSTVGSGTAAYTVADLRRVKLSFAVSDKSLAQFSAGTKVRVIVDSLPGKTFSGTVLAMAAESDPSNRLFRATADIDNPTGLLRAGLVASVMRAVPGETRELAVPVRAIRRLSSQGDDFGVLVIKDSTVEVRKVTLGPTLGSLIAVRQGVSAGEMVAEDAGVRISTGDSVQVVR